MTRPPVGIPTDVLAPHAVARWARDAPDRVATSDVDGAAFTYARARRHRPDVGRRVPPRSASRRDDHVATLLPNGPTRARRVARTRRGCALARCRSTPRSSVTCSTTRCCAAMRRCSSSPTCSPSGSTASTRCPRCATVIVGGDRADPRPTCSASTSSSTASHPPTTSTGRCTATSPCVLFTSGTTGPSQARARAVGQRLPVLVVGPRRHARRRRGPLLPAARWSTTRAARPSTTRSSRGATFVFRERFSGTTFWDDVRRYDCKAAALVGPMTAFLHAQPRAARRRRQPAARRHLRPAHPRDRRVQAALRRRGGHLLRHDRDRRIVVRPAGTTARQPGAAGARTDYPWPEVRVVDEHDEPLGPGEVGELVVRAAEPWALNAGYYGMPEATAAAWRNGWFHTGDAFRYDEDGNYFLVDRLKDAIRRRGENISSFEVEQSCAAYPGVAECAAIGVPAEFGDDEVMVVVEVGRRRRDRPRRAARVARRAAAQVHGAALHRRRRRSPATRRRSGSRSSSSARRGVTDRRPGKRTA